MSSLNTSAYRFARPTGLCAITSKPIEPGAEYTACLVESIEENALIRVDLSMEAWEAGERPEQCFAMWHATMPTPEQRHNPFLGDDELMAIFDQLCESGSELSDQQQTFQFLLALLLLRKRLLRQDGSRADDNGTRVMLLRRKGENKEETEAIEVPDPGLRAEEAAEAAVALGQALRGDE